MTLIELMVVIVILVTLVAGVLPLVSPNNDARKIAEAARGLQTYFMQAQAEAARLGRPVGVGFRETTPGSGVAVEAFQLAVPQPYAGLDQYARVKIYYPQGQYGDGDSLSSSNPRGGEQFLNLYNGYGLYHLKFVRSSLKAYPNGPPREGESPFHYPDDSFPLNMFQVGDVVNLEGNEFLIVDGVGNEANLSDGQEGNQNELLCVWINDNGQQLQTIDPLDTAQEPGVAREYKIFRQPATGDKFGPSAEAPFQLPAGVCIDLQASGLEAGGEPETFAKEWEGDTTNPRYKEKTPYLKQIGLMFSPNGGIDGVWFNGDSTLITSAPKSGNKITGTSSIFLLLGRIENQNIPYAEYNFPDQGGENMSDEQLRERRLKVNWLNPDSRWMMLNANDGRLSVSQNSVFDPRLRVLYENDLQDLTGDARREGAKIVQIEAAHGLAHDHSGDGQQP